MTATFVSLLVILLIALAGPLIAGVIPHKPIPEVVFLIFLGALLGPNMAGAFTLTEGVETVSELGVAFLFLIAGYEINPRELAGNMGKTAAGTWVVCFGVALGLVALLFGEMPGSLHDLALAIVLTTTAYGTLAPILKERGIMGTPVGKAVVAHGVVGELFPVLAIAILLSTRARWEAVLIVLLFFAIAAVLAFVPARARKMGAGIYRAIESLRETNAQTMVRFTMVLLLALVALSAIFDLDVVLGAFVAGVVLHYIIPEGDHALEHKIESMGFGLFIPVFFVVSGAGIDLAAVAGDPLLLLGAVAAILVARGVPVFVSTFVSKQTRDFGVMQRLEVTLYSTMALPLIVAVCSIAVDGGFMLPEVSSTLITAGALTVLIIPVLASLTRTVVDAHPVATVQDLVAFPDRRDEVLAMYRAARRDARERYRAVRKKSDRDVPAGPRCLRRRARRLRASSCRAAQRAALRGAAPDRHGGPGRPDRVGARDRRAPASLGEDEERGRRRVGAHQAAGRQGDLEPAPAWRAVCAGTPRLRSPCQRAARQDGGGTRFLQGGRSLRTADTQGARP